MANTVFCCGCLRKAWLRHHIFSIRDTDCADAAPGVTIDAVSLHRRAKIWTRTTL